MVFGQERTGVIVDLNRGMSTGKRVFSGKNLFLLIALTLGHTLMHCVQQGWYIFLPSIKGTFGLSDGFITLRGVAPSVAAVL